MASGALKHICSGPLFEGSKVYEANRIGLDGNPVKRLIIEGYAIVCDTPGINGRSYPTRIMSKQVDRLMREAVPFGRLAAELNHPRLTDEGTSKDYPIFEMNLSKTCAVVEELRMDGNKMYCRMVVAEGTPAGDTLAALIRTGYRPGYSIRGAGETIPEGDHEVITDDYILITIDVVGNPSFGKSAIFDSHVESVDKGNPAALVESINTYRREVKYNYDRIYCGNGLYNRNALLEGLTRLKKV